MPSSLLGYNSLRTEMAVAPGKILGQYEIRSPLGAGGMGEVYRAYDTRLQREVAIKVLPESLTSDPDRLRRFEQEARATAALNHPNVLAIYQMATQDGISFLVSELLEGETLRERLRRGILPRRKAIDYAVQIARGLAAPHEKGIVHRDLKPENLFLTNDGRVKILDFGLAKVGRPADPSDATVPQGTDPGIVMGTVGYMSPEQVRGRVADHRSDIFAFGAILYEMLTGKQTFHKPTSAETMTAILNEDPAPISQIAPNTPPGLQRVVHRCLEKNPEQRFQSASDLAFALESLSDAEITSPTGAYASQSGPSNRRLLAILAAAAIAVIGAAVITYFLTRPPAVPKVSNYVQLTHDGKPKVLIGNDGSRLYLYQFSNEYQGMAEMSISGGEPRRLAILPSANTFPVVLSPNGSEVLVVEANTIPPRGPLWTVPVLGGSPRRMGDAEGQSGSWSPDSKLLAYGRNGELFVQNSDGTQPRKLTSMEGVFIMYPVWSPDGTHIRFDTSDFLTFDHWNGSWEISLDGTGLHRLLPNWKDHPVECCGRWTADAKYFVFRSGKDLWALPEKSGIFQREPEPVQLTSSQLEFSSWMFDKDGKKLLLVGRSNRGELMRYDARSRQFVLFLGGISAEHIAFSEDGQWVAYISYPEGTLWRSRVDGTDRLQLSYPPNYAVLPRWSHDGKTILFSEVPSDDKPTRMLEISSEGGIPRPLLPDDPKPHLDANWSPDGSKIVFSGNGNDASSNIRFLDLKTHQLTTVPGSNGLFSPRLSPDGKYLAALSSDLSKVHLFDFKTETWRQIGKGLGWPSWSKDSQYLILSDNNTGSVVQIRIGDGKTEQMLDLKNFAATGHWGGALALTPDGSPLLLRDAGTQDVYALDFQEP